MTTVQVQVQVTHDVVINNQCYNSEASYLIMVNLVSGEGLIIIISIFTFIILFHLNNNCQAQGPTLGPTQGRVKVKVKVRTWSGHGQVRSNSNSNSNSKVGPELYTKIGFHHSPALTHHHTTPSLNECLVNFVTLCDTL